MTDLDTRVQQLVAEMVDTAPPARSDVPAASYRTVAVVPRSRVRVVGAAVIAVVVALGLAVLIATGDDEVETVGRIEGGATATGAPLGDGLLALADDQWVVPTVVPEGLEYELAVVFSEFAPRRLSFVAPGGGRALGVQIVMDAAIEARDVPGPDASRVGIGGVEWLRSDRWGLMRRTTDGWLAVSSEGLNGAELVAAIESLVIVDGSELPRPPLDRDDLDEVVVARALWDGRLVEMRAVSDGLYYGVGADGGWTCCTRFGDGDLVTFAGGTGVEGRADGLLEGIVDERVDRVRLILRDGTEVEVGTQDLSDERFGVDFVLAVVPLEGGYDPFAVVDVIVALDANGEELGRGDARDGFLVVRTE
ncbi:MAG: hypothetical protein AAGE98_03690 [Actinomycetota bacterium]